MRKHCSIPFIFMMVVSFFKFSFADPLNSKFVGFNNFITVFTKDRDFKYAFTNTILFAFFTVFILMIITVSLAAWLSKNTKINNDTKNRVGVGLPDSFFIISQQYSANK